MSKQKMQTVKGLVKQLREIRDKTNAKLARMTPEERTEYFRNLRANSHVQQLAK